MMLPWRRCIYPQAPSLNPSEDLLPDHVTIWFGQLEDGCSQPRPSPQRVHGVEAVDTSHPNTFPFNPDSGHLPHPGQVKTDVSGFVSFNALPSELNLWSKPSLHHLTDPSI